MDAFDDCDCADALLQIRGHPFTIPQTPFHDSADTHSRFRRHPCTIPRTPLLDSADTRTRFRGYPRRCRGKTADFRRRQSVDFVKFLVTSTVRMSHTILCKPGTCSNMYVVVTAHAVVGALLTVCVQAH